MWSELVCHSFFFYIDNLFSLVYFIFVGSHFSTQAQDTWDFRPVSPVQWICREWAKELGFSVWTTVNTVFFTIKLRWTEFSRKDWSLAWNEELFLVPLVCCFGGGGGLSPTLSVSLHSLFIVVSFLLNWVPRVSTCPINPSLKLLGVVVKAEKHGYVRHKALNAIMSAFPSDISIFRCPFLL